MATTTAPTTERNKAVVRRFFEAFAADDRAALNDLLSPDLVAYSHGSPDPQGREGHMQGIVMWNVAFSDTRFTIEEQIAEGDSVASRVTMTSVHDRDDFQGVPPSGKEIATESLTIERIAGGRIVERRVYSDWRGLMQQLAAVPPRVDQ